MGFSIGGFDPQKAFHTLVTDAERALGGVVNKVEQKVAPAIQQVPGASQAFDLFESGANALSQKLHLPGASNQDTRFDGQFLDVSDPQNPRAVSPNTPLEKVPAVLPNNGRKVED